MDSFSKLYRLKADSIGPPSRYLGADIGIQDSDAGVECWAMSSDLYVRNALQVALIIDLSWTIPNCLNLK